MKKLAALFLGLVMAVSLVGCGGTKDTVGQRFTVDKPPRLDGSWYLDGSKSGGEYLTIAGDTLTLYKTIIPGRDPLTAGEEKFTLKMDTAVADGEGVLKLEPFFANNPNIVDATYGYYPILDGDALVREVDREYKVYIREDRIGTKRGTRARACAAVLASSMADDDYTTEIQFTPFGFTVIGSHADGENQSKRAEGTWVPTEKNTVTMYYADGGQDTFDLHGYADKGVKIKRFGKVFKPMYDVDYYPD